jgi:CheY-like chemotaxis protein
LWTGDNRRKRAAHTGLARGGIGTASDAHAQRRFSFRHQQPIESHAFDRSARVRIRMTDAEGKVTRDRTERRRADEEPLAATTQTGRRPTVLLADDIPVNQLVARRLLEQRGCDVDVAADGEQAVDMHGRGDYAVIFMDCQMPVLDGYEATAEIRRREGSGRHTPIVAMTADAMQGDRERCLAAGMDDYLAKPLEPALLDEMLGRMLRPPEDPPDVDGMPARTGDGEPGEQPPVLDAGPLAEICGGNDSARDMLLAMFAGQATATVTALGHALQTNDLQAARRSAHALTGSSATLGARRLAAVARRICEDITSGHATDAIAAHAELQGVLALTLAAFAPDAPQQPQIASSDPG